MVAGVRCAIAAILGVLCGAVIGVLLYFLDFFVKGPLFGGWLEGTALREWIGTWAYTLGQPSLIQAFLCTLYAVPSSVIGAFVGVCLCLRRPSGTQQ